MTMHEKDKYVVVLPCEGSPYIHGIHKHNGKGNLELLQSAVGGLITGFDRKNMAIHSMIVDPRWDMAREFLACRYTNVYVNDNGANECAPNMLTVKTTSDNCPHLFGDVALVVRKKDFESICPDPSEMAKPEEEEEEEELPAITLLRAERQKQKEYHEAEVEKLQAQIHELQRQINKSREDWAELDWLMSEEFYKLGGKKAD